MNGWLRIAPSSVKFSVLLSCTGMGDIEQEANKQPEKRKKTQKTSLTLGP